MRIRILPYRQGSKSAKALSEELKGKVLRLENSLFKPKSSDIVINWGSSKYHPALEKGPLNVSLASIFNYPEDVVRASNKLSFFELMKEEELDVIPQFWTNEEDIPDEAFPVVCRTVLNGHSGSGIVIADSRDDLVDAPLFVQYVKKKEEYRVHVGITKAFVGGDDHGDNTGWSTETKTIAIQRKARRLSVPDDEVNWKVRNLAGGFVFTREGFIAPSAVEEVAHRCLRATGLDFGAVDVIWNEQQEKAYVLEVNTAPGLEGQTVKDYAEFFRKL